MASTLLTFQAFTGLQFQSCVVNDCCKTLSRINCTVSSSFKKRKSRNFKCRALYEDDEDYLVDAPVEVGDGFSFPGGKYADTPTRADEWFARGKIVKTSSIHGNIENAKDPIFGLKFGQSSQMEEDSFRWFYVEAGNSKNHPVILTHGLPSQAYSFRKVLQALEKDYYAVAFDWLGFGFSDKPQPNFGFEYTHKDYRDSFGLLMDILGVQDASIVSQGYFAPVIVSHAKEHQSKIKNLILINPPVSL
eukprot:TRINITY_DN2125_c0_g1_i6.p1 TRINITY_DN2125_c0_g1~~TRINITY_DN2125_c0_g1_i6.p1  ORF type:complete len:247 (-),score=44.73 TRINITY_DN2125_c0_g1_i6:181-921(-)